MKPVKIFSWVALMLVFACESEGVNEQKFVYKTNQDISTVESFIIDFETFDPGDIVSEIELSNSISNPIVAGVTMAFPNDNAAMVFDSSNPTGGDFDLGTPNENYGGPGRGSGGASNDVSLGNVLILSEDLDSSDPDDIFEIGASFILDFSGNGSVTMNSFDILDIEDSNNPTLVNLFGTSGELLLSTDVEPGGDNSKVFIDLMETTGVAQMEVIMNSSGAIDNIAFDVQSVESCTDCDSSLSQLTFKYNGTSDNVLVVIETTDEVEVFNGVLSMDEEFTVSGNNQDGSFSGNLVISMEGDELGVISTDCSQVVGPGLLLGNLEVIAGRTTLGGALCPIQIAF